MNSSTPRPVYSTGYDSQQIFNVCGGEEKDKANREIKGTAPPISYLGTRWKLMVRFRLLYPQERAPVSIA